MGSLVQRELELGWVEVLEGAEVIIEPPNEGLLLLLVAAESNEGTMGEGTYNRQVTETVSNLLSAAS